MLNKAAHLLQNFQYTMHFLLNHPELKDDICETLKARQHDPEESVRYEVVMAIGKSYQV